MRKRVRSGCAGKAGTASSGVPSGGLRSEGGFGLVELLLAMLILNVGLLAVVAAFTSGTVALKRAGKVTTASILADQQMELYRALKYDEIALDAGWLSGACCRYTADAAYSPTMVTKTCAGPTPPQCHPFQDVTGADGDEYRVDTYIVYVTPPSGRQVKKVTVVVRDKAQFGGTEVVLARQVSTFDQSTG